jgi:hypothetical protein
VALALLAIAGAVPVTPLYAAKSCALIKRLKITPPLSMRGTAPLASPADEAKAGAAPCAKSCSNATMRMTPGVYTDVGARHDERGRRDALRRG